MVALHTVGEPVRSLVRVSGEGHVSRTLCWDLSRTSSMVAALAPLQLPGGVIPDPTGNEALLTRRQRRVRYSSCERRSPSSSSSSSSKRLREDEQQRTTEFQSGSEEEVQRLRLQCRKLQQQNEDLQQRLSDIYSLLKDKQRRTSLMRQLDVNSRLLVVE
nr:MAG: hypothetical protein [Sesarmops intermedium nimavirus]